LSELEASKQKRPLKLFANPSPIEVMAAIPDGPPLRFRWRRVLHDVARAQGPERIAAEWWLDADGPTRDYFEIEDTRGGRYWVYREGLYGRETNEPRWFVHGLFG
ncbi:MAG: DNA polymerase Y family protein, partial [Alphaproteobacteria bacterium]